MQIWLRTWGGVTLLSCELFQCVLLPLSFSLQVAVMGVEVGFGGEGEDRLT